MGWFEKLAESFDRALGGPERRRQRETSYDGLMRQQSPYYAMQQDHAEYFEEAATDDWWEGLSQAQRDFIGKNRPLSTLPLRAAVEHFLSWYRYIDEDGNLDLPSVASTQRAAFTPDKTGC